MLQTWTEVCHQIMQTYKRKTCEIYSNFVIRIQKYVFVEIIFKMDTGQRGLQWGTLQKLWILIMRSFGWRKSNNFWTVGTSTYNCKWGPCLFKGRWVSRGHYKSLLCIKNSGNHQSVWVKTAVTLSLKYKSCPLWFLPAFASQKFLHWSKFHVKSVVCKWLKTQSKDFYTKRIENLVCWWKHVF